MIGFTSGSTASPRPIRSCGAACTAAPRAMQLRSVSAANRGRKSGSHDSRNPRDGSAAAHVRDGAEHSVAAHRRHGRTRRRRCFPRTSHARLAELPAPRVLVSTPLHLRMLVESSQPFPTTALIVSATAPLDRELAAAVEARLGGQLLELFARPRRAFSPSADCDGGACKRTKVSSCIRARTVRWSQHHGSSSQCCCRIS